MISLSAVSDGHLAQDTVEDAFDLDIFTTGQTKQDFSNAGDKLQRHIYDYVVTDSSIERQFVHVNRPGFGGGPNS